MVLAERNSEIVRNGRRSRGPSPNGHAVTATVTPETSSDDDNSIKRNGKTKNKQSEYEEKIRVGRDYQAVCPPYIPETERKLEVINDRALLVWSPTIEIPESKLEDYISVAKERYGYNGEQALGMLFWHKHDLERAVMDLANFTPFPDEWTTEDKTLFDQAFSFHGKSFHRIRQMLPDKSIASLVKYYYSWKKSRTRSSVLDRQEKIKANKDSSDNGSENGSNEDSENEDKDQTMVNASTSQDSKFFGGGDSSKACINKTNNSSTSSVNNSANSTPTPLGSINKHLLSGSSNSNYNLQTSSNNYSSNSNTDPNNSPSNAGSQSATGCGIGCCTGCGVPCNILNSTTLGKMCNSCYHHWRRTGNKRPTSGPYFGKRYRDRNADKHRRKPPRGMHINHDDIVALASSSDTTADARVLLLNTEREIITLLGYIQQHKQQICSLKRKNSESSEELRQIESSNRVNSRWTNDELLLAVHGVRKFGKDFQSIAETIGTKTEAHVRTFYVNYRRRYSLDQVLKEHEAEKEAVKQEEQKKKTNDVNETDDNKDLHIETVILGNDDDDDTNGISTSNCIKFQEDNVRSKTASPNPNDGIISIDIDNETSERPLIKKINLPTSTAATTTV